MNLVHLLICAMGSRVQESSVTFVYKGRDCIFDKFLMRFLFMIDLYLYTVKSFAKYNLEHTTLISIQNRHLQMFEWFYSYFYNPYSKICDVFAI